MAQLQPDVALALIAGLATALMMAVNPDMPEQLRIVMIVIPSILAIVAALHFSSALAIYWAKSVRLRASAFHAAQARQAAAGRAHSRRSALRRRAHTTR
jgi:hypothetical protein